MESAGAYKRENQGFLSGAVFSLVATLPSCKCAPCSPWTDCRSLPLPSAGMWPPFVASERCPDRHRGRVTSSLSDGPDAGGGSPRLCREPEEGLFELVFS